MITLTFNLSLTLLVVDPSELISSDPGRIIALDNLKKIQAPALTQMKWTK